MLSFDIGYLIFAIGQNPEQAFRNNEYWRPRIVIKHKNSKYDQEIPQSQTADKPVAPRGRATQQLWDTRK